MRQTVPQLPTVAEKWVGAAHSETEYLTIWKRLTGWAMEEIAKVSAWKLLIGISAFFVGVNTSVIGYIVVTQFELANKMIRLESTTLTVARGDVIMEQLHDISTAIAAMPKENPPRWLLDNMARTEKRLDAVEARMAAEHGK